MMERLQADLRAALKSHDALRLSVLRMLLAAVKNARIAKGEDLAEEDIVAVIRKEIKRRNDSISAYTSAGREELAKQEIAEKEILEAYVPAGMSEEEIQEVVKAAITEVGSSSKKDFGKVMGAVMQKVRGRAEGDTVRNVVFQHLTD